jgi:hypothetical protein
MPYESENVSTQSHLMDARINMKKNVMPTAVRTKAMATLDAHAASLQLMSPDAAILRAKVGKKFQVSVSQ